MTARLPQPSRERIKVISTAFYHDVVADDEPIIRMQTRFGALRVALTLSRAMTSRDRQPHWPDQGIALHS